jgi:hypothetical protein
MFGTKLSGDHKPRCCCCESFIDRREVALKILERCKRDDRDAISRSQILASRSGQVISIPRMPFSAAARILRGRVWEACWPSETLGVASLLVIMALAVAGV